MASVSDYCKCSLIQLPLTENSSSGAAGGHACRAASAQFVLVQFLSVRGLGKTNRLRRSGYTFCIQGKMYTVKSAEHRYRVIAPQSSVTPNDLLWYTHDPAGNTCIAAVDKLPTAPVFVSCGRTCLTGIVFRTLTELFFVTIVLFAGEKGSAVHVLSNIGFESPVLIRA